MFAPLEGLFTHRQRLLPLAFFLALYVLIRGIFPSLWNITTDFPNYYTAARIIVTSGEASRLYDDAWFQRQMHEVGFSQQGKFSPFPPATALLFIPFVSMSPLSALRLLTIVNITLLAASIFLLARLFRVSSLHALVFVLLAGTGLANCFRFGQLYILLSFTMLLAVYLSEKDRPVLAGISAGILLPIKYFSIINVVDFAFRRQWKVVGAAIAAAGTVIVISVLVMGVDVHREFLTSVFPRHLRSDLSLQDPYSASFQSIDSLLRRLFLFDREANPRPLVHSPFLFAFVKGALLLALGTLMLRGVMVARKASPASHLPLALICVTALLVAPATASYHFVLLWLPVAILMTTFYAAGQNVRLYVALACYAGIGFLPLSWFRGLEGLGGWTVFAYPRLALMTGLFALSLSACKDLQTQYRTL